MIPYDDYIAKIVNKLRELDRDASLPEWYAVNNRIYLGDKSKRYGYDLPFITVSGYRPEATAELIVAMRNYISDLLDAIEYYQSGRNENG